MTSRNDDKKSSSEVKPCASSQNTMLWVWAELEWLRWLEHTWCHTVSPEFESHQCVYVICVQVHGSKSLSYNTAPEVNLRNQMYVSNTVCKWGIYPGHETQGSYHQKSKTGASQKQKNPARSEYFWLAVLIHNYRDNFLISIHTTSPPNDNWKSFRSCSNKLLHSNTIGEQ